MRHQLLLFLFLFLLGLASSGCSPNGESEVIGTYKLVNSSGLSVKPTDADTLRLLSDHSYQIVSVGEDQIYETGTWEFVTIRNSKYVSFHAQGSDRHEGLPVKHWFFSLYIGADEDGAKLYKKID